MLFVIQKADEEDEAVVDEDGIWESRWAALGIWSKQVTKVFLCHPRNNSDFFSFH